MNVQLSTHAQIILQRHLSEGGYATPEDLIEHALDLLDSQEPTLDSLKSKLNVGLEDIAAGRFGSLDVEDIKSRGRLRLKPTQEPGQ